MSHIISGPLTLVLFAGHKHCRNTPVIKNIIGKRCVFDVKINEYNTVRGYKDYTVYRLKLNSQTEQPSTSNKDNPNSSKKQRVN